MCHNSERGEPTFRGIVRGCPPVTQNVCTFLISSLPAPENAESLSRAFLFWRCTTVEPIIDRRERNPDEFCQSVPA